MAEVQPQELWLNASQIYSTYNCNSHSRVSIVSLTHVYRTAQHWYVTIVRRGSRSEEFYMDCWADRGSRICIPMSRPLAMDVSARRSSHQATESKRSRKIRANLEWPFRHHRYRLYNEGHQGNRQEGIQWFAAAQPVLSEWPLFLPSNV